MEDDFAAVTVTNTSVLCVGGITRAEATSANDCGIQVDGLGYYLFLADQSEPQKPIEVLAKFADPAAAEKLLRLFRLSAAVAC